MNVLCISIDSLRPDYTSFSGELEGTTPFLSELSETTVFNNAVSPSTWTLQVHGSIFTGLYPPAHNVHDKGDALGLTETFAEKLSVEGYDTISVGGNGWLNAGDILRGFDHHHISPPRSRYWFETMYDGLTNRELSKFQRSIMNIAKAPGDILRDFTIRDNHHDRRILDKYINYLDQTSEPFCHFIHLNGVHNPYTPHMNHYKEFGDASYIKLKRNIKYQQNLLEYRHKLRRKETEFDRAYLPEIRNLYKGTIHQTDQNIRDLMSEMERRGYLDNTIVIIFGDHGDHIGEENHWGHQFSVADEVIRVPLIIRDPNETFHRPYRNDVVQLNDLYPTILDVCDVSHSISNSINLSQSRRKTAFTYYTTPESYINRIKRKHGCTVSELPPTQQFAAWRDQSTRATWYPNEDESTGNTELIERLKEHYSTLEPIDNRGVSEIDKETEQNLRDMGYI